MSIELDTTRPTRVDGGLIFSLGLDGASAVLLVVPDDGESLQISVVAGDRLGPFSEWHVVSVASPRSQGGLDPLPDGSPCRSGVVIDRVR